jgi:hypothetical protein
MVGSRSGRSRNGRDRNGRSRIGRSRIGPSTAGLYSDLSVRSGLGWPFVLTRKGDLSRLSCSGYLDPVVLSQQSCPSCRVIGVTFWPSCPSCFVNADLSGWALVSVLSQLSWPDYPAATVLSWLHCYVLVILYSWSCQAYLSRLICQATCPDSPVPALLSRLSSHDCPAKTVLSQLSCPVMFLPPFSCHGCPATVPPNFLSQLPTAAVLP